SLPSLHCMRKPVVVSPPQLSGSFGLKQSRMMTLVCPVQLPGARPTHAFFSQSLSLVMRSAHAASISEFGPLSSGPPNFTPSKGDIVTSSPTLSVFQDP